MTRLGRVPGSPAPCVLVSCPGTGDSRGWLRNSVRGSHQLADARAVGPPRPQSPPTRPARPAAGPDPRFGTSRAARAFPAATASAWGPGSRATPALPAGRCQGVRAAGSEPRPQAGRPVSPGQGRYGSPPPTRWALRSPPRGAAHPPSSPATVAVPRRAPPPCWLLFPFPVSIASGPSANEGSQLRAFPANGITYACAAPEPHGSCSPSARPSPPSAPLPPATTPGGQVVSAREALKARSGLRAGIVGAARTEPSLQESGEESGSRSGLVGW